MTSRLVQFATRAAQAMKPGRQTASRRGIGEALRGQQAQRVMRQIASTPGDTGTLVNQLLSMLGPVGQIIKAIVGAPPSKPIRGQYADLAAELLDELGQGTIIRRQGDRSTRDRNARDARRQIEELERQLAPRPDPAQAPPAGRRPPPPAAGADEGWPEEHDIELLGRGSVGYDRRGTEELIAREIMTPASSNVYSFVWEEETDPRGGFNQRSGILYVTFKAWHPGQKTKSNSAGPMYAYYDVPLRRYRLFESMVEPGGTKAGVAVWEYLRVRGSKYDHRYPYRLVAGSKIPAGGVYVPRKATKGGYRKRAVTYHGTGKRRFHRSSLPELRTNWEPNRAKPNRGRPNRGKA